MGNCGCGSGDPNDIDNYMYSNIVSFVKSNNDNNRASQEPIEV